MMKNRWPALLVICWAILGFEVSFVHAEPIDDYNSALKLYEKKRWENASDAFTEFLEKAPDHSKAPLAQLYLGQSLTHAEKYEAARTVFRKFLVVNPQHTDAPLAAYRIGESSYFLGEYKAASTELESFVKTYPNHELAVWGWQYLGEARLQTGDALGAIQAFEVVLNLKTEVSEQVEAKFYLAKAHEALNQDDKAAALYKEVSAANHPRAAEALFGIAETEYKGDRFEAAAKTFEALITRFPKHSLVPTAELNAGYSRYQSGDTTAAEKHFEAAANTAAISSNATFWTGMCRKSRSEWAGAAQVFEGLAAKQLTDELAEKTTYHWADCESKLEHYDQAYKLFLPLAEKRTQAELDLQLAAAESKGKEPEYGLTDDSHYSAADSALRGKQTAAAIRLAESFPTRFKQSRLLVLNEMLQGRAILARGDEVVATNLEQARVDFQAASQRFRSVIATSKAPRTTTQARIFLARTEKRLNNPAKVVDALLPVAEAIKKGETGSGDYAEALPMLGEALLSAGRASEAEAVLADALQSLPATSPQRVPTLMKLADSQASLQKWTAVDATLNDLAAVDPTNEMVGQSAYENAERAIAKKEWATAQQLLNRAISSGEGGTYYATALSSLGLIQAEQGQQALAAETYRKLWQSPSSDAETKSAAAFNVGICLEKDAGEDATKLAAAAETLSQAATQFAAPPSQSLADATEQKVAIRASTCARQAAKIEVKLKRLSEADKLWELAYNQLEKLPPADQARERPDALLDEWARYLSLAGNAERGDAVFAKLYQNFPQSIHAPEARFYAAQGHDKAAHVKEARELYQWFEVDTTSPAEVRQAALTSWLTFESRVENWKESQRIADLIVQSYPNTPVAFEARFRQGEAQVQRQEYQAAATTLTALRNDPALPKVEWRPQLELLWVESELGLPEQDYAPLRTALEGFLEGDALPELAAQAHEILGRIELKEGHFDEARTQWGFVTESKASEKTVLAAKAQLAIADSFLTQKNYKKAISAYNKLSVSYPFPEYQAPALLLMAKCDMELKDWAHAKSSLDSLISEFPKSPEVSQASELLKTVQQQLPAKPAP